MSPNTVRAKAIESAFKSEYATEKREEFLSACLPEPVKERIELREFHADISKLTPGIYEVWFVTRQSPQSVFFDEQSGQFGTCWGPEKETGRYTDLGYRSEDPVEMYLA